MRTSSVSSCSSRLCGAAEHSASELPPGNSQLSATPSRGEGVGHWCLSMLVEWWILLLLPVCSRRLVGFASGYAYCAIMARAAVRTAPCLPPNAILRGCTSQQRQCTPRQWAADQVCTACYTCAHRHTGKVGVALCQCLSGAASPHPCSMPNCSPTRVCHRVLQILSEGQASDGVSLQRMHLVRHLLCDMRTFHGRNTRPWRTSPGRLRRLSAAMGIRAPGCKLVVLKS